MRGARTPAGALVARANLTRTGVYAASAPGSTLRACWPREEVFDPEALESLAGVPITIGHPLRSDGNGLPVTPANWRAVAVGHVAGTPREAGKFVQGEILIEDGDAIAAVERGDLLELSAGYAYHVDPTPGVYEGQPYDVVHRSIRFHHVALVPPGTAACGRQVRLHLDAAPIASVETITKQQEKKAMERAMRYDEHADQVAEGMAIIQRGQLEAVGFPVPRGASPAFIEGMFNAAVRGGKIGPRTAERGDARSVHGISATVGDRLALFAATLRSGRCDAALDVPTAADAEDSANEAHSRMIARQRDRWLEPRADRDASRERGIRRPTTPAPSGMNGTTAASTERPHPNSFEGNSGDPSGDFGGGEGMFDGAETRVAQRAMVQRQRDAWKKPRADRRGKGGGNSNWDPAPR